MCYDYVSSCAMGTYFCLVPCSESVGVRGGGKGGKEGEGSDEALGFGLWALDFGFGRREKKRREGENGFAKGEMDMERFGYWH